MLNLQPGSRLEVWGDPVEHSRSPDLHAAAYRALGLDWTYERRRVAEASFAAEFEALDRRWRGLSLTMPLKRAAFAVAHTRDRAAELTGAVNTLLITPGGPHGYNTDVGGLVADLREHALADGERARVVGAGATATSVLAALAELGTDDVEIVARRPEAAAPLRDLGARLGIRITTASFDAAHDPRPFTIATLPGGATMSHTTAHALAAAGGTLYDVLYRPWPTTLAGLWQRAGGRVVSGRGMLLHQALAQVRIFVTGTADESLPDEDAVLTAMRGAVMGD